MKGMVFNMLNVMVERQFGLDAWEAVLDAADSDGIYTAGATYEDAELLRLVAAGSDLLQVPVHDLVRGFGNFMFPHFVAGYPTFFLPGQDLKQFLLTVDQVIHMEVRKLYPDAHLPSFDYDDSASDRLVMRYTSPRRLCMLAEGLIQGAAEHFKTRCQLTHPQCMHDGADACLLELDFSARG